MGKATKEEQNYSKQPFLLSVDEITNHIRTNTDSGLSSAQAKQHVEKYGENYLEGDGGVCLVFHSCKADLKCYDPSKSTNGVLWRVVS